MKKISLSLFLALGTIASVSCQSGPEKGPAENAAVREDDESRGFGEVLETMNSAGYTYMRLGSDKGEFWIAATEMEVGVGDEVEFAGAMPMQNFHSDTLNRTFPEILFVGQAGNMGKPEGGARPSMGLTSSHPPVGAPKTESKESARRMERSEPGSVPSIPGALSVAEVFAGKAELTSRTVRVVGKVVKVNANIMGKNWIHLQDGTEHQGQFDLLVTASEAPEVGSVIVAEGNVATDQDFGAGYAFSVMIENGRFTAP